MDFVQTTLDGETVNIINVTGSEKNTSIAYIDSNNNLKVKVKPIDWSLTQSLSTNSIANGIFTSGGDYVVSSPDFGIVQENNSIATVRKILCEFDINGDYTIPTTETLLVLQQKNNTLFQIPKNSFSRLGNKPQLLVNLRCGINNRYPSQGLTIRLRVGNESTFTDNPEFMKWYIDLRRVSGLSNQNGLVECVGWAAATGGGTNTSAAMRTHANWLRGEGVQSANLANVDLNGGAGGFVELQPYIDPTVDNNLYLTIQWDVPSGYNKVISDGYYYRMTGKSHYRGGNLNSLQNIKSMYYPASNGLTIYGIASGRGTHVAVGQTGNIHCSRDGNYWQPVKGPVSTTLRDVCWFDSQSMFIACGDSSTILTSPDGFTWTQRTTSASLGTTVKIAAGATKAYIVGYGSGKVLSTTDGITWTEQVLSTAYSLNNVAAAGSYVLVVGTTGRLAFSSDSGVTWTFSTTGSTSFTCCTINPTTSAAIAMGTGVCSYTSAFPPTPATSATSWAVSTTNFTSATFVSVASDTTSYCAVTSTEDIWYSTNKSTWTNQTIIPNGSGYFWGDVGQIEL